MDRNGVVIMEEQTQKRQLDWKGFKRWRTIQVAAILPLCVTVVLMIYFREAAEFHVVAFFLVLIVFSSPRLAVVPLACPGSCRRPGSRK